MSVSNSPSLELSEQEVVIESQVSRSESQPSKDVVSLSTEVKRATSTPNAHRLPHEQSVRFFNHFVHARQTVGSVTRVYGIQSGEKVPMKQTPAKGTKRLSGKSSSKSAKKKKQRLNAESAILQLEKFMSDNEGDDQNVPTEIQPKPTAIRRVPPTAVRRVPTAIRRVPIASRSVTGAPNNTGTFGNNVPTNIGNATFPPFYQPPTEFVSVPKTVLRDLHRMLGH
eukprot:889671_1